MIPPTRIPTQYRVIFIVIFLFITSSVNFAIYKGLLFTNNSSDDHIRIVHSSAEPSGGFYQNHPSSIFRPNFRVAFSNSTIDNPIVTVVIPFTCNKHGYLAETLLSVYRQSLLPIEILIINDGCDQPHIITFLDKLAEKSPKLHIHHLKENQGLPHARNLGFQLARGEFIFLLDSDDLIEPTTLEKLVWLLKTDTSYAFANGFTVAFGHSQYVWMHGFYEGHKFLESNMVTPMVLIRKAVHRAVGGFTEEEKNGMEDWDFWLKCAANGYWGKTIFESTGWYRSRAGQENDWRSIMNMNETKQRFIDRYKRLFAKDESIEYKRFNFTFQPEAMLKINPIPKVPKVKRVLFILPWMVLGGSERFNLELCQYFVQDGWDITIAATLPWKPYPFEFQAWEEEFFKLTRDVFILYNFLPTSDTYSKAVFLAYLVASRQPDVVIVTNSELGYASLPLMHWVGGQMDGGGPLFIDYVHMPENHWHHHGGYAAYSAEQQSLLDATATASDYTKKWLVDHGAGDSKVHTCYIGAAASLLRKSRRELHEYRLTLRTDLNISDDMPVVLFAARMVEQKRPDKFAEVIESLSQVTTKEFAVLVAGSGDLLDDLKYNVSLFENNKPSALSKIHFLDEVPLTNMDRVISASDIVFLPSVYEGIALVAFEAMALGKVFVGADIGGQSELIPPNCNCGVLLYEDNQENNSGNVGAFVGALKDLIENPSRRQEMGRAAKKRIQKYFTSTTLHKCMMNMIYKVGKKIKKDGRSVSVSYNDFATASAQTKIYIKSMSSWTI